jgi:hypothetical protein
MPYQSPKTIEEIAAQALIDAIDDGLSDPEEIREAIESQAYSSFEIAGFDYTEVIDAYVQDPATSRDDRTFNPDFQWACQGGTLMEALFINCAMYIAEVAVRIYKEEEAHINEPDLEDYPLR